MTHLLETDSVHLSFGLRNILSDVYLKVETGKITGLLGRNGAGKTCLMNIMYGSLEGNSQSVRLDSKTFFHAYKHAELLLYLPQFNFIPLRITIKNVFRDYELDYDLFVKSFPEFKTFFHSGVGRLSGGQRRLLEVYIIARSRSKFILLDEPFSHIMPLHIEKIREILLEEKRNKGILVTDHMYHHIINISDPLYVLKDGKTYLTKSVNDLETLGYARL